MGLQLTLQKTENSLFYEFIDAYWKLENIMFTTQDGIPYVEFWLNTYPNRETSKKARQNVEQTIGFGSATNIIYMPKLREWCATFRADEIFHNSIPLSESDQKDVLYNFVKAYTGLPFVDVFEEVGGDE